MLMIMERFEVSMRSRMLPEAICHHTCGVVYHVLQPKVVSYF